MDVDVYRGLSVDDLAMLCAFKDDTIEILQRNLEYHMDKLQQVTAPKEVATFCDVAFRSVAFDHTYTYLTGGLDLKVGDSVVVPVGPHHNENFATVVAVYNRQPDKNIPYKTVHRKDNINV